MRGRAAVAVTSAFVSAVVALTGAQPASATPQEVVRNSLLTTDALTTSGRFSGTMNERGFVGSRRVISTNSYSYAFNSRAWDMTTRLGITGATIRFVAVNRRLYTRAGRRNYFIPLATRDWRALFRHTRTRPLTEIADLSVGMLSDWRDDGPGVSDEVPVQTYSGAVEFFPLAERLLPRLTEAVYDGVFNLFVSDPSRWETATLVSAERPRVFFGIGADGLMRSVRVDAPERLTTQGFELTGNFEFADVNEPVSIRPLRRARRVTKRNERQFMEDLFGASASSRTAAAVVSALAGR